MRYSLALLLLATGCATLIRARATSACRAQDENTEWLLERARSLVAPTDSVGAAGADSLHVPRASASSVQWVFDPAICARALAAYRATSGRPDGVSERVYVIRAGQVYVVLDPEFAYLPGRPVELYTTAIFDADWRLLSLLAG